MLHFPIKLDVLFYSNLCVALVAPQVHKFQFFVRFWFAARVRFLVGVGQQGAEGGEGPGPLRAGGEVGKQAHGVETGS